MIVIDASALIEWLMRGPKASLIEARAFGAENDAHAPHLVDIEVAHVFRRLVRLREISAARGREALADLADTPIRRVAHLDLLERVWALRDNFSAYDATYVALAEALDAPLVTADGRLARSAERWVAVHAF